MTTKMLLTASALALGLALTGPSTRADNAMAGMDMGGMKMPPKAMPAPLSVTATLNPAAPQTGDNTLDLTVLDAGGRPVTGLKLTATVAMTSMDMGTTHPAVRETGNGHYTTKVSFGMDGPWRVVVHDGGSKLAVLDFVAGAKTPWKSPQAKAAGTSAAPAVQAAPGSDKGGNMAGMDMGDGPSGAAPSSQGAPAKPADAGDMSAMPGMKTGIADMKTATVPRLEEQGTYTATGDEDWKAQAGFGHNAGMVGMMNQMMVGGSGMEGMKMPSMKMDFGEKNYARPEPGGAGSSDSMSGMDMGGGKGAPGNMKGMDTGAKASPGAQTPPQQAPNAAVAAPQNGAMPGMDMGGGKSQTAAPPAAGSLRLTATLPAAKAGDNVLDITLTGADGSPVSGAKVTATVAMTSMDMGTSRPAVTETGNGHYAATIAFGMAGPWRVTLRAAAPGQKPLVKAFLFNAK